jgi:hypothetical protein
MSTISEPTTITTIEKDLTWIRGHILVALLTVALIVGSIIGGISLFENMVERHDARVAQAQLQKEGVDTATTTAFMAALTQDRAANAVRDTAQAALIQTLVGQMAQQHAQTAQQIKTDATLDAKAAAERLVLQMKASPTDVTVNNDLVTLTLPLTRNVVTSLDLLPQAQSDVTNLQGQLGAQKILTSDAKTENADAQKVIAADKVELIAAIKADNAACVVSTNAAVDKQASKDRKRSLWVMLLGAIAGGFIGHAL